MGQHKKIEMIDTTVQKTYEWLAEIRETLAIEDSQVAYHALRSVLHALRDRLAPEEAASFAAQLPTLVRGIFYEGWHPADKPLKIRSRDEFYKRVANEFVNFQAIPPERLVETVFGVLEKHVSKGEIHNIASSMPRDLKELWPVAV